MPEQALYLKWRPLAFDDVVGQDHITRTLRNALVRGRVRHAYLFGGPRGTGKTTNARLLAKAVNCTYDDAAQRPCNQCSNCVAINEGRFLDLIEIDAASHTGVDDVRELRDKIAFAPGEGQYKVYIIDEVHRFSGSAFDALLKTLEEPPSHAIFVLATTEIDKVPATIKSRCLQFEFRRVSLQEVRDRLAFIAESEGLQIEAAALELIARQGTGSVRDSISLLDQIVTDPDERVSLELTQKMLGTANTLDVRELMQALVGEEVAAGIHIINRAIDSGSDPRQFGQQIVECLRNVMLAQTASADLVEASQEERAMAAELAGMISRARLLKAIRAFNEAVNNYTGGWQPQLALELAFIDILQNPAESPAAPPQPPHLPAAAPPSRPLSRSEQAKMAESQSDAGAADFERAAESAPGEAPIYSAVKIHRGWAQLLERIFQYNRNLPPLLEHAHVRAIEGNRLILGVQNAIFQEKIAAPARAQYIEQAVEDLHRVKLRVEVRVVSRVLEPADEPLDAGALGIDADAALLLRVRELGGVIDDDE